MDSKTNSIHLQFNSFIMEKDKVVFCRPFYCPQCESLRRPLDEYYFIVFGHDNQTFFIHKARYKGIKWITPSIIFFDGKEDDTHKEILVACGVVGCGVEIYHTDDKEYPYDINIKKVRLYKITRADYKALLEYKDETYKLD
jgi:hypothetical protein